MIRIVVADKSRYPHHSIPASWTFQVYNLEGGQFFQNGEDSMKPRRAFNKVMFAGPKFMTKFNDDLIETNNDLMNKLFSEEVNQINLWVRIPR